MPPFSFDETHQTSVVALRALLFLAIFAFALMNTGHRQAALLPRPGLETPMIVGLAPVLRLGAAVGVSLRVAAPRAAPRGPEAPARAARRGDREPPQP